MPIKDCNCFERLHAKRRNLLRTVLFFRNQVVYPCQMDRTNFSKSQIEHVMITLQRHGFGKYYRHIRKRVIKIKFVKTTLSRLLNIRNLFAILNKLNTSLHEIQRIFENNIDM